MRFQPVLEIFRNEFCLQFEARWECRRRCTVDSAVLHVDHAVGPLRRKRPVRNYDCGDVLQITIELGKQLSFRSGIKRGRAFVENENAWSLQERTRQRDTLTFATGKPVSARA